jgi:prevent-host-death family protein
MDPRIEVHEAAEGRGGTSESSVGAYEAKTHLPQLLDRVECGEAITITRHGKPVARLMPAEPVKHADVRAAVEEMKRFQKEHGPNLGPGVTLRALIEEGRRF